jgi:glycosyltransferase involved in cell wall biosynthesis
MSPNRSYLTDEFTKLIKGPALLLEAWAKRADRERRLVIAGTGPEESALKAFCRSNNLHNVLTSLARNTSQMKAMGMAGYERARNDYSAAGWFAQIEPILQAAVAGQKPEPGCSLPWPGKPH